MIIYVVFATFFIGFPSIHAMKSVDKSSGDALQQIFEQRTHSSNEKLYQELCTNLARPESTTNSLTQATEHTQPPQELLNQALYFATLLEVSESCKILLDAGADMCKKYKNNIFPAYIEEERPPLFYAFCRCNNSAITEVFKKHFCKIYPIPSATNTQGELLEAIQTKNAQKIDSLMPPLETPSATRCLHDIRQANIERRLAVHQQWGSLLKTALIIAMHQNNDVIVQRLLEYGIPE